MRGDLSLAAYELVLEKGFENVTVDDMAAAGGVSRSTFLRYFHTKNEAVLIVLETHAERLADALRLRPADEDDWTALRRAIETFVVPLYMKDRLGALAMTRLILETSALSRGQLDRRDWRTPLTQALAERAGITGPPPFALALKVVASMECLNLAIGYWNAADGEVDLVGLIEEGFAVLGDESVRAEPTR